jgi:hypothetical protein
MLFTYDLSIKYKMNGFKETSDNNYTYLLRYIIIGDMGNFISKCF